MGSDQLCGKQQQRQGTGIPCCCPWPNSVPVGQVLPSGIPHARHPTCINGLPGVGCPPQLRCVCCRSLPSQDKLLVVLLLLDLLLPLQLPLTLLVYKCRCAPHLLQAALPVLGTALPVVTDAWEAWHTQLDPAGDCG